MKTKVVYDLMKTCSIFYLFFFLDYNIQCSILFRNRDIKELTCSLYTSWNNANIINKTLFKCLLRKLYKTFVFFICPETLIFSVYALKHMYNAILFRFAFANL